MTAFRHRAAPALWLALAAMLALSMLPTVSRALAWAQGATAGWAEICTPQGARRIAVGAFAPDRQPAPQAAVLDHCAYCTPSVPDLAPPPARAATTALPAMDGSRALAVAARWSTSKPAWAPALPRAPPTA